MAPCVSTMTCAQALAVQPALTRKYVDDVLDLLMDTSADFSLSSHEFLPAADMDKVLLAEMAAYVKERLGGNTQPLEMDYRFDSLVMDSLASDEDPFVFAVVAQGDRFQHYNAVCRQALQKHKCPLSCVAAPAARAAGFTEYEIEEFLRMVAAHDFSKIAFPAFFCAGDKALVPGSVKPLLQFAKKDTCPFFKLMFSFVQMHRLLEITHHQSVLTKTTGRLRELSAAYLEMCTQGKLTYLEIACDTAEASLSRRCPTRDDQQDIADASGVHPWVDYTSKNFMKGQAQELPEPTLGGILALLFPSVAQTCVNSGEIMETIGAWTTSQVRLNSPVFHAIYTAYDEAVLEKSLGLEGLHEGGCI